MSPGYLAKAAADTNAVVGIEFEMHVPGIDDEQEVEPDYDQDTTPNSFIDIVEFFSHDEINSRSSLNRVFIWLDSRYQDWVMEQIDKEWSNDGRLYAADWLYNNRHLVGSSDQEQEQALEQVLDRRGYYDDIWDDFVAEETENFTEKQFLEEQGLRSMVDVETEFDLIWPYCTESGNASIDDFAQEFTDRFGVHCDVGSRGTYKDWTLTTDVSLTGKVENHAGLELISPPMPLGDMGTWLSRIMTWAQERNIKTSRWTGLHINVSISGHNIDDLDYVKLVLLLGDRWILDQFGRSANQYCRSAFDKVKNQADSIGTQDILALLSRARSGMIRAASRKLHGLSTNKYTSIHIKPTHVEFRSPGGDWLNQDHSRMIATINRFAVALDAAMDPNKYRQEYLKKFYSLLQVDTTTNDPMAYFALYSAGLMTRQDLTRFIREIADSRRDMRHVGQPTKVDPEDILGNP